jgi:two-component system, LytTR family, response regulator
MMADLRVVVADDEPLIRRGLTRMLESETGVRVVGQARHGKEALAMVEREAPDLLFLDVQMPEMNGLEVAAELSGRPRPGIVFVTAFDRYAVKAFDHYAIDYLLKPFDEERLGIALTRARARLSAGAGDGEVMAARLAELLARFRPRGGYRERFIVQTGNRVVLVNVTDVEWIEAADNYARLHAGGVRHVVRETLKQLETDLDPGHFVRIHRSCMVNLSKVKELRTLGSGDCSVTVTSGASLTLSRRYRAEFERRVGGGK